MGRDGAAAAVGQASSPIGAAFSPSCGRGFAGAREAAGSGSFFSQAAALRSGRAEQRGRRAPRQAPLRNADTLGGSKLP